MSDPPVLRESLNGVWVLDKSRGKWSMRGYLATLDVTELAIQAHEKGELDHDTYHTISVDLDQEIVKIVKRSRVNNDLVVELKLGEEDVQYLQPGDRAKKSLATSEDHLQTHLTIKSSLLTMNGMAHVTDTKRLVQEDVVVEGDGGGGAKRSVLIQELTIVNEATTQSNTTTRFFNPYTGPDFSAEPAPAAEMDTT
jgi:hypothetical protein